MKYLYKHNFKYETKPIKWMCRSEAGEEAAMQKLDAIYFRDGKRCKWVEAEVFYAVFHTALEEDAV